MTDLKTLMLEILNEIEKNDNILNLTGVRGYGTGRARNKNPHSVLEKLGPEEGEEKEEYELKPVKISKAFKRRKNVK